MKSISDYLIWIFSFIFTPLIPPKIEKIRIVASFSRVIYVIVAELVNNPLRVIAVKIIIPFIRPSISPLLLLIREAIYPPKNTDIASIKSIM